MYTKPELKANEEREYPVRWLTPVVWTAAELAYRAEFKKFEESKDAAAVIRG